MLFRAFIPRPPLSAFIADFWMYEDYGGVHSHERILPSGTFELVFNLREDEIRIYGASNPVECRRFEGAVVSGPYTGPFMSDTAEEAALLGVHFKPGGACAVLGIPAGEFADTHVGLSTLWGSSGRLLREQLCSLRDPVARFELLERALLERLAAPRPSHGAVHAGLALLLDTRGQARIRDVARAVDLSQRRFTDLFLAQVGLAPKLFARIQRFQHAVASSQNAASVDWSLLAAECGYFDQSHLVHEFLEFSGASPSEFRLRHERLERAGAHVKRHHLPVAY